MTRTNGHATDSHSELTPGLVTNAVLDGALDSNMQQERAVEPATRTKLRAKEQLQQNRFLIIAAGAIVTALLVFAAVSMPRSGNHNHAKTNAPKDIGALNSDATETGADKSLFPIMDSGRAKAKDEHQGFLNERDLQRTVTRRAAQPQTRSENAAGTLGSIAPFGEQAWQAPPYRPATGVDVSDTGKQEHEGIDKSSLVYVRKVSTSAPGARPRDDATPAMELGLAAGTRLRGRLEAAASTAVRTPLLAVIEYNYESEGEIVVPAGAKAIGHIRSANRSGYVDIQFDSLLLPDGSSVPIQAAATDLNLRPLKGKVEGKNAGKSVLVRSLSGIGQAGSLLLGQNNLNQPLNESDLLRERLSSNIGEAGDEEVSRLAISENIVVTVSAGAPIYVVMEQAAKPNEPLAPSHVQNFSSAASNNADQLRQLLQLQRELSQPPANSNP